MPLVKVEMFSGRTLDQKRDLVKKVTDAIVQSLGSRPEQVRVLITEMQKEHHAFGGILTVDRDE